MEEEAEEEAAEVLAVRCGGSFESVALARCACSSASPRCQLCAALVRGGRSRGNLFCFFLALRVDRK